MRRAFLDVDTQIDFVYPSGALYVPGADEIIPAVAALNRFAIAHAIPLISTVCAHRENDPEFLEWPPHCVVGTMGQQKPHTLLMGQRIFEKAHTDLFLMPEAEEMVASIDADEWVIYGVATEVCVQAAAFGLLERSNRVVVVSDAVKAISPEAEQTFLDHLQARGGRVVRSLDILEHL